MIRFAAVSLLLVTGSPAWLPGEGGAPDVSISVENWGADIALDRPGAVAFAHLAANGPPTTVTVTIDPGREGLQGYVGRLIAPDAFGGELVRYCGDETGRTESAVLCRFDVPMVRGENQILFDLQSGSFDGVLRESATVIGGSLDQVTVLEVRAGGGSWVPVTPSGEVLLPGWRTSELRYRIMNTGDLPFRVRDGCQDGTVWPGQQLLCPVRGPRPVYALRGAYEVPFRLDDPVGGGAGYSVAVRIGVARSGT